MGAPSSSSASYAGAGAVVSPSTTTRASNTGALTSATATTVAPKAGNSPLGLPASVTLKVLAVILKVLQQGPSQARCAAASIAEKETDGGTPLRQSKSPLSALLETIASHWDPNSSAAVSTGSAAVVAPLSRLKGPSQGSGTGAGVTSNVTTKSSPRGWGGASAAAAASVGVLRLISRSSGNRSRHNTGSWSVDDDDDFVVDSRSNGPMLNRSGGSRNGSSNSISGGWRSRHNTGSWAAEDDEVDEENFGKEEDLDNELKNLRATDPAFNGNGRWNWSRPRSPPLSLGSRSLSRNGVGPRRDDATQSELLAALNAEAPTNFGRESYLEEEERGDEDDTEFEIDEEARQTAAEVPPWDRPHVLEKSNSTAREAASSKVAVTTSEKDFAPPSLATLDRPALIVTAIAAFARAIQARAAIHGAFAEPWEAVLTKVNPFPHSPINMWLL